MAIISFYSLKIIFGHFTRCNWTCLLSMVFVGFFGGKWYKNGLFEATTHKKHRFYGIKRWNTMRKKKYLWYHLYHCDHDDRLILASYVVLYRYTGTWYRYHKLNKYFTGYPVFKILGYMYPVKVQT